MHRWESIRGRELGSNSECIEGFGRLHPDSPNCVPEQTGLPVDFRSARSLGKRVS